MIENFDAIVVGARAAGSATAMLLAQQGRRVLAVDRSAYGSDVRSTHALLKGGVIQLHRWGLLDDIRAAGTPAITHTHARFGSDEVTIPFKPRGGVDSFYAPKRTVLDPILADAARDAGADVRFRTAVTKVVRNGNHVLGVDLRDAEGNEFSARAPITIGADGVGSLVARSVNAAGYHNAHHASAVAYTYVDHPGVGGYEWFFRPDVTAGIIPTNGGSLVWVGVTPRRYAVDLRPDSERGFYELFREGAPEAYDRIAAARRTARFFVHSGTYGYFRKAFGPGWALVGDAGHFTDPLSAHGLTDALRDAELLARAIDRSELEHFELERDRLSMPLFDIVDRIASYEWDTSEVSDLLFAVSRVTNVEVAAIEALDAPIAA